MIETTLEKLLNKVKYCPICDCTDYHGYCPAKEWPLPDYSELYIVILRLQIRLEELEDRVCG